MKTINAPKLHIAVKFLKEIRAEVLGPLPHYGNYGLFLKNNEITTGLMNNKVEIKINLLDGSFHFFDTEDGVSVDFIKSNSPKHILNLLNNKNFKIPKFELQSVPRDEMSRFLEFAKPTVQYLELFRMRLKGKYTQVYLWGHNFDFDLVWFTGSRSSEVYDEQIDIGISPGDSGHPTPYLYVTPRPFNDELIKVELPIGIWVTESWKGIQVEWNQLLNNPHNEIVRIIEELFNIGKKNFEL